jgi:hypothetical protein
MSLAEEVIHPLNFRKNVLRNGHGTRRTGTVQPWPRSRAAALRATAGANSCLLFLSYPTLYRITGVRPKPLTPQIWPFVPETVDTPTAGANSCFLFLSYPTLYKITGVRPKPLTPQIWSFVPETVDTPTVGANSRLLFQIDFGHEPGHPTQTPCTRPLFYNKRKSFNKV